MKNPYGRLTLIRSVILRLTHNPLPEETPFELDRGTIWRHWSDNFFCIEKHKKQESPGWQIGFPALQQLVLDFSDWRLEPRDGLIVRT